MRTIKYILINDTVSKTPSGAPVRYDASNLGHHTECFAVPGFKVQGSKERAMLLNELVRLRRQWPDAKILGVSEVDPSASHAPVRVNPEMNALRRAMSDLP